MADLQPDPKNARKHNPRNVGMIEQALREVGAGRSIVLDENNVVLAGNATIEAAAAAGIENVKIVETDGNTIVAVRRSGLTDAQKAKLALYDNRTAELAEWDEDVLRTLCEDMPDVSVGMWSDAELAELLKAFPAEVVDAPHLADGEKAPFQQMTFTLHDDQAEKVNTALERAKRLGPFVDTVNENSNGNALARVCEVFLGQS